MGTKIKDDILKLRKDGKSFREIQQILGCAKSTISYHCSKSKLSDIGLKKYKELSVEERCELIKYYETHTKKETSEKFGISISTVSRWKNNKRIYLTDEERKKKNYKNVKNRIQLLKKLIVEYKGGKCERCGYDRCIWAFDLHHKNKNDKDFNISGKSISLEKLKKEADKCSLICSNCHREIHYEEYISKINVDYA